MKVSIYDVARKSGLSVVTVSRVINQSTSVRANNREKVLRAMEELDYHPNASARSLARGKTGVIGLTLTNLHDSFFDAVVKEINDRLAEQGYFLALSFSTRFQDSFHRSLFQQDRVDGVILLSPVQENEYVLELEKRKIPFIMIDNQQSHSTVTSIIVDNFKGGYEATKHLLDLGHTEIAHISGSAPFLSSKERERGYLFALEEAGLLPYCIERGTFAISSGYEIAKGWIDTGRIPPAIFAADDNIALGVMDALKNEGIRIPRDVSIVGFDDTHMASEFRPRLTTVRQPAEKIGREAVRQLLAAIDDTSTNKVTLKLDAELVIRESTAHPRKRT